MGIDILYHKCLENRTDTAEDLEIWFMKDTGAEMVIEGIAEGFEI